MVSNKHYLRIHILTYMFYCQFDIFVLRSHMLTYMLIVSLTYLCYTVTC